MIKKLNSKAVRSILNDYRIDVEYTSITSALVKRGELAAFLATTNNVNALGAYIRRRFPSIWRDYIAVAAAPNYMDFVWRSEERGIVWPEVTLPEGSIWLVDLDM